MRSSVLPRNLPAVTDEDYEYPLITDCVLFVFRTRYLCDISYKLYSFSHFVGQIGGGVVVEQSARKLFVAGGAEVTRGGGDEVIGDGEIK